jgi:hypothetical protein
MVLHLFKQDIRSYIYLYHMSKASAAVKKHSTLANFLQILVKNRHRFTFIAGDFKAFFIFFCLDFLYIDPSNNFSFCKFFAKHLKSE